MRNYRLGPDSDSVIFKSDIEFNQLFCFISILFVDSVHVQRASGYQMLTVEGMSDDTFKIDTTSNSASIMYLSYVLTTLNETRSSDQAVSVSKSLIKNNVFKRGTKATPPLSQSKGVLGKSALPYGERSYSSSSTTSNMDARLTLYTKRGDPLIIEFRTLDLLKEYVKSLSLIDTKAV